MIITTNQKLENNNQWTPLTSNPWFLKTWEISQKIYKIAQNALENTKNSTSYLFKKFQHTLISTNLSPIISQINSICSEFEQLFNIGGATPWLGILSGNLRCLFGQTQIILGIGLVTISEIGLILSSQNQDSIYSLKWKILSKLGIEFIIHGSLNNIRGTGESLLGTYTLGLGNIILILPNLNNDRNFLPYFSYGTMTNPKS